MTERSFREDLTGSDESLDDLLARLEAELSVPRVKPRTGRRGFRPPDADHFVTSRGPRGGLGGAEAPLPKADAPPAECYAAG